VSETASLPPQSLPRGIALLQDPSLNKGTAFTASELLPPRYANYVAPPTSIQRGR
jgi:hypothetical protein